MTEEEKQIWEEAYNPFGLSFKEQHHLFVDEKRCHNYIISIHYAKISEEEFVNNYLKIPTLASKIGSPSDGKRLYQELIRMNWIKPAS